jgi:anti-sigma factor RsiW
MSMTNQNKPSYRLSVEAGGARVTQDEGLASVVSSYLDGELSGEELVEFETLLLNNEALSREIAEMRRIDQQLTGLGADILAEPIPEALLEALGQLEDE